MVEIIALAIAAATLGILVWMAKGDAYGWTKKHLGRKNQCRLQKVELLLNLFLCPKHRHCEARSNP